MVKRCLSDTPYSDPKDTWQRRAKQSAEARGSFKVEGTTTGRWSAEAPKLEAVFVPPPPQPPSYKFAKGDVVQLKDAAKCSYSPPPELMVFSHYDPYFLFDPVVRLEDSDYGMYERDVELAGGPW